MDLEGPSWPFWASFIACALLQNIPRMSFIWSTLIWVCNSWGSDDQYFQALRNRTVCTVYYVHQVLLFDTLSGNWRYERPPGDISRPRLTEQAWSLIICLMLAELVVDSSVLHPGLLVPTLLLASSSFYALWYALKTWSYMPKSTTFQPSAMTFFSMKRVEQRVAAVCFVFKLF